MTFCVCTWLSVTDVSSAAPMQSAGMFTPPWLPQTTLKAPSSPASALPLVTVALCPRPLSQYYFLGCVHNFIFNACVLTPLLLNLSSYPPLGPLCLTPSIILLTLVSFVLFSLFIYVSSSTLIHLYDCHVSSFLSCISSAQISAGNIYFLVFCPVRLTTLTQRLHLAYSKK